MKLKLITVALIYGLLSCKQSETSIAQAAIPATQNETPMAKETIYQFKVEDLEGNTFDFSTLKGKKILIVNTASK